MKVPYYLAIASAGLAVLISVNSPAPADPDLELLRISDKGLARLQRLKNLKRLNIAMVVVSDEAVSNLQATIRGLEVLRWRIPGGWP